MRERLEAVGCGLSSAALDKFDNDHRGYFASSVERSAEASTVAVAVMRRLRELSGNDHRSVFVVL